MSVSAKPEQTAIAERLQEKLLKRWEKLLDNEELSPADAKTLTQFLATNGWNVDPSSIPVSLAEKLNLKKIDPTLLEDGELN